MALSEADKSTLAALYATFVPANAPAAGVDAMVAALERLPPSRLREMCRFLALLRTPVISALTIGSFKPFESLKGPDRERLLQALCDHRLPQFRTAYQAMKRLALFVAYSLTNGARHELWNEIGYPGPRNDVPAERQGLLLRSGPELSARYDVAIIGSGAGGGVAAAVCAQRGMSVLVLEAGPSPAEAARAQQEFGAFANLYLDAGLTSTDDLAVAILAGSCLGGGTTVNWSTSLELSRIVAQQWSKAAGGINFDEALSAHYRSVAGRMEIAPSFVHNPNNAVLKRGAEALDWRGYAQPRNAAGCDSGCGYCGFGCAYGRKRDTPSTFLADAVMRGAHVITNAPVQCIRTENGRAQTIDVAIMEDGLRIERSICADRVIVAAGALRTPGLLAGAGVRSAHCGSHLHLHPTTAVLAEFAEDIEPWNGPMQSYLIDEFGAADDAYGVKLEAVPAHPGLAALALPWRSAADHRDNMKKIRKHAALIALVRDRGEGSVSTEAAPKIRYGVSGYDARHLRLGVQKLAEAALAAGAQRVQTLHNVPLEVHAASSLGEFNREVGRASAGANRIGVFSAHQMGTARMHADSARGVVDAYGRVHGFENLYVADSSVFPLASGVNPMLTIMALAHRTAVQIDH